MRKRKKENALWEEFVRLRGENVIDTAHLVKIQDEMDMLEKIKCDGAIVRSRAKYVIEGERNTRYFLNLERQRQEQCSLSVLVDKDGTVIKDFVPLIEHVYDLYKSEGTDGADIEYVLDQVVILIFCFLKLGQPLHN